ncbi:sarcosine oxidase subunit alpha [Natranaerovirga pectinivora]|uniref:Sarcosine oxidase subunit alpha n=1 Tax=Natranaerovirga pectinivora TaxID=682400 RepID=A0A4R3MNM2_9FIRM|nr:NAD(P)/FAD-dependent oxidoreductase [Natranaerovirga pectinivora]TCT16102.1 sarcosine oxidase subunit alpha [Natranaerovirga pectinivora]
MIHKEIVIVGGGPAGLSAGIEAAKYGAEVLIIDENHLVGGQLFKQIHKFFGSREHKAGMRGFSIGRDLLEEINKSENIELWLNSEVIGINKEKELLVVPKDQGVVEIKAEKIILATGAIEKSIYFPGWDLPGVMGAGAAQTMMNVHRILPGKKVLMIGSGNVGVIISYQMIQGGAEVVGILEASSTLGGYGVHTAKVTRAGVPFYRPYTIKRAIGEDCVEGAEIVQIDSQWQPVEGTEVILEVDLICMATGFNPLTELAWMSGCQFTYIPELGGQVPTHNDRLETTVKGIYIAGDISGIEEASTAMEEGKLAGVHAAHSLGYLSKEKEKVERNKIWERLNDLRSGPMDIKRKNGKELMFLKYNEGCIND